MDKDIIFNIKETLGKATKTVVTKSNDIVEMTKLRYAISDGEQEISKLMREIGKCVYDAYKNNTEPSETINVNCAVIDEKYAQLDDMRAKLNTIKKITECAQCGKQNDKDAVFCSGCGAKLEAYAVKDEE